MNPYVEQEATETPSSISNNAPPNAALPAPAARDLSLSLMNAATSGGPDIRMPVSAPMSSPMLSTMFPPPPEQSHPQIQGAALAPQQVLFAPAHQVPYDTASSMSQVSTHVNPAGATAPTVPHQYGVATSQMQNVQPQPAATGVVPQQQQPYGYVEASRAQFVPSAGGSNSSATTTGGPQSVVSDGSAQVRIVSQW